MANDDLRVRFDRGDHMIAAAAWDGMSATIIEKLGFDMVCVGSGHFNGAWAMRGGMSITPSQVVDSIFRIRDVVDIPILVDMEQGYGGPKEAAYWLRQFERAGASMVWVTDFPQVNAITSPPKITAESPLASPEEHTKIIEAMIDTRRDILVGARTWSHAITGLTDAIRRLQIYKKAGADVLWAHFPEDKAALRRYRQELTGPIAIQTVTSGYFPARVTGFVTDASFKELEDEGVQLIIFTGTFKLAYRALSDALSEVKRLGNVKCIADRLADKSADKKGSEHLKVFNEDSGSIKR